MIKEKLREEIFPLYTEMLSKVKEKKYTDVCAFCAQWGSQIETIAPKNRMLFVGKAVNSWHNKSLSLEELFGNGNNAIFARNDQMLWVKQKEGNGDYNTNKSAFWRLIKGITQTYHPQEWHEKVAWSNLFKIAPFNNGGNPAMKLRDVQRKYCWNILEKEIEVIDVNFVIMLTSGWEGTFLTQYSDGVHPEPVYSLKWGKYTSKLYRINIADKTRFFIATQHPQGKSEIDHIHILRQLIEFANQM